MITVKWANEEKRAIVWKFGESWTRKEFYDASSWSKRLALSVDYTFHIIVDMSIANNTPSSVINLARYGISTRTNNLGRIVVITRSHLWNRLYQYMEQAYPLESIPLSFVDSFEEAIKSLPLSPENLNHPQSDASNTDSSLVR